MKKLLLIAALLCSFGFGVNLSAQNSYRQYVATATGPDSAVNETAGGINYHLLTWTVSGTVSTCTVALDSSSDGVTWTSGGAISGQTCTSAGNSGTVAGTFAYVRIDVTALSGAGATVNVVYTGYNSSGGSSIVLQTNGTNNGSQSKLNLAAGSNVTITDNGSGTDTITASSTAATAFSALTSATNTQAAMLVGTGASLAPTGSGTVNANEVNGAVVPTSAAVTATNSSNQVTAASTTGSGSVVLATSPTLVTPALGTPSAVNLTNATSLPATALPALTGDVTSSAGSAATTVVKVNGAVVPTSTAVLATNSSNQLIAASAINLAASGNGGVTGNLPVGNLNSGTGASSTTFWRGDGTWATPSGGGSTVYKLDLTGQSAAVAETTIFTPATSGYYVCSGIEIETTVGSTGTLPYGYLDWTDGDSSTAQSTPIISGPSASNVVGSYSNWYTSFSAGVGYYFKGGDVVQFHTTSPGSGIVFAVHVRCEQQ